MVKRNTEPEKLSGLLNHFFDHEFEFTEEILDSAVAFIFDNVQDSKLKSYRELYDVLFYLRDIRQRNFLKDVNGLTQYYEKKQQGIDELFDRFEEARAEKTLATMFQAACETHLNIQSNQKAVKSECLYYPVSAEGHYLVGYENISYRDTLEEEISYLAKIEGNLLIKQCNVSIISSEKNKQLISN